MLNLAVDNTVEQSETSPSGVQILIDEQKIKTLFEQKIINKLAYIYFALEIEKSESPDERSLRIDKEEFCERWDLRFIDVDRAILDLDYKGKVTDHHRGSYIQLSLIL